MDHVERVGLGGEHDDGYAGLRPDLAAHGDAVTPGEHQVEQDEVRPGVAEHAHRPGAVAAEDRVEALSAQHDAEHLGQGCVVIDDQHASPHSVHRRTNEPRRGTVPDGLRLLGCLEGRSRAHGTMTPEARPSGRAPGRGNRRLTRAARVSDGDAGHPSSRRAGPRSSRRPPAAGTAATWDAAGLPARRPRRCRRPRPRLRGAAAPQPPYGQPAAATHVRAAAVRPAHLRASRRTAIRTGRYPATAAGRPSRGSSRCGLWCSPRSSTAASRRSAATRGCCSGRLWALLGVSSSRWASASV